MPELTIAHVSGSTARISQYGAHLLSWRTASGKEWMFLSQNADYEPGKSIRGGVPIIFPQFNQFGPWQRHGFARNVDWSLNEAASNASSHLVFELNATAQTLAIWPFKFEATFRVVLIADGLEMVFSVKNSDQQAFDFTAALHSYFSLSDLEHAQLIGLAGQRYWNNDGAPFTERKIESENVLPFSDAIDRVYFDVKTPLQLRDQEHTLEIAMNNFSEVVVWNPGAAAAAQMKDMAPHEYRHMLCVEAASIDNAITLKPGESWSASQVLTVLG